VWIGFFSVPWWSTWAQGAEIEENEQKRDYNDRITAFVRFAMLAQGSPNWILMVWEGKWLMGALIIPLLVSIAKKPTRVALCRTLEIGIFLALPVHVLAVRAGIIVPAPTATVLLSVTNIPTYCAGLFDLLDGFLATMGVFSVIFAYAASLRVPADHAKLVISLLIADGVAIAIFAIKSIEKQRLASVANDLKYSACAAIPMGLILAADPLYSGHAFWSSWEALSDAQIAKVWRVAVWSSMFSAFVFRFPPENLAANLNEFKIPGPSRTLQTLSTAARMVAVAISLAWMCENVRQDNWRGLQAAVSAISVICFLIPVPYRMLCMMHWCATYLLLPALLVPQLSEAAALLWPLCTGQPFVAAALHISLGEHLSEVLFVNGLVFAYGTNSLRAASTTATFLSCLALCVKMTVVNYPNAHKQQGGRHGPTNITGSCSTSLSS